MNRPPRYDDVFYEGVAWLDSLADEPRDPLAELLRVAALCEIVLREVAPEIADELRKARMAVSK